MKYTVVSSAEFTYPDIWDYPSSACSADTFSARGGYASFQILFGERTDASLALSFGDLPAGVTPEVYTLFPVQVERNHAIEEEQRKPHYPERVAPYYLYDCLRPFDGSLEITGGVGGLYVALKIDKDAVPGVYTASLTADGTAIPVTLTIYAASVPAETLKMIHGFSPRPLKDFHGADFGTEAYFRL